LESNKKGKTYEELYGPEKAKELKKNLSVKFSKKYVGENNPFFGKHHSLETKHKFHKIRAGKTYEEIYGTEKAELIKNKLKKEKRPTNYFTEYDEVFYCSENRQVILKEQNYLCAICLQKLGYKFKKNLHHINYIKKDNRRKNLIYLCVGCHVTTNGNREFWKGYLRGLNREINRTKKLSRKINYRIEKSLKLEFRQMIISRRV